MPSTRKEAQRIRKEKIALFNAQKKMNKYSADGSSQPEAPQWTAPIITVTGGCDDIQKETPFTYDADTVVSGDSSSAKSSEYIRREKIAFAKAQKKLNKYIGGGNTYVQPPMQQQRPMPTITVSPTYYQQPQQLSPPVSPTPYSNQPNSFEAATADLLDFGLCPPSPVLDDSIEVPASHFNPTYTTPAYSNYTVPPQANVPYYAAPSADIEVSLPPLNPPSPPPQDDAPSMPALDEMSKNERAKYIRREKTAQHRLQKKMSKAGRKWWGQ